MADIEQLDRALKWIEANPELHDQDMWATRTPCSTTMCVAMVVAVLNGWQPRFNDNDVTAWVVDPESPGDPRAVDEVARELLGIDAVQEHALFISARGFADLRRMRDLIARGEL